LCDILTGELQTLGVLTLLHLPQFLSWTWRRVVWSCSFTTDTEEWTFIHRS